jgi:hypothetical protein
MISRWLVTEIALVPNKKVSMFLVSWRPPTKWPSTSTQLYLKTKVSWRPTCNRQLKPACKPRLSTVTTKACSVQALAWRGILIVSRRIRREACPWSSPIIKGRVSMLTASRSKFYRLILSAHCLMRRSINHPNSPLRISINISVSSTKESNNKTSALKPNKKSRPSLLLPLLTSEKPRLNRRWPLRDQWS